MYVVDEAVFNVMFVTLIPSKYVFIPKFSSILSVTIAPRSAYVSFILMFAGLLPCIVITGACVSASLA